MKKTKIFQDFENQVSRVPLPLLSTAMPMLAPVYMVQIKIPGDTIWLATYSWPQSLLVKTARSFWKESMP
jgi:hypothetical protein